jgi:hypothetical protein
VQARFQADSTTEPSLAFYLLEFTYRVRARGASTKMPDRLAFRGAFKTSADDGAAYTIDLFEIMQDGPGGEICGALLYRTSDGKAVRRLESGIYKIEESGLIVRSTWLESETRR